MGRQPVDRPAAGTVRLAFRWLSTCSRPQVRDRVIASNPCVGVRLPKLERKQVEPLTVEQVASLAGAVGDRYATLVVFAAGMGIGKASASVSPSTASTSSVDRSG